MIKKSIITTLLVLVSLAGLAQNDDLLYIFPCKGVYETGEDFHFLGNQKQIISPKGKISKPGAIG